MPIQTAPFLFLIQNLPLKPTIPSDTTSSKIAIYVGPIDQYRQIVSHKGLTATRLKMALSNAPNVTDSILLVKLIPYKYTHEVPDRFTVNA